MIIPPPDDCCNEEEGLNLPAFGAHLLNVVANAGTRHWLQSGVSLGNQIVDEIAVTTGFFSAGEPEGQDVVRLINERSAEIFACLAQAEDGESLASDNLNFLQR